MNKRRGVARRSRSALRDEPWLAEAIRTSEGVRGGHLDTILARLIPASYPSGLPAPIQIILTVAPQASIRVQVTRNRPGSSMVVLVHGLGGNSRSGYVMRTLSEAFRRGYSVTRVDLRNAGGTHRLSKGLFNILQWPDIGCVLDFLRAEYHPPRIFALGYSLGGAMLLNLVAREPAHRHTLAGVVGINPPIDICRSVAQVCRPENVLYIRSFARRMVNDIKIKRRLGEAYADPRQFRIRTVPDFDTQFVVPETPFDTLEGYYRAGSASPHLSSIDIPAHIISARNDPLIPPRMIEDVPGYAQNVKVHLLDEGGHVGYLRRRGWALHFSAAPAALDFCDDIVQERQRPRPSAAHGTSRAHPDASWPQSREAVQ